MKTGRPHNLERREEIKQYLENGLKPKEIARLMLVDRQLIEYYIKRYPHVVLQKKKK